METDVAPRLRANRVVARVWSVVRLVSAAAILAYVLWRIQPARFVSTLAGGRPALLGLLAGMGLVSFAFQVGKWKLVLHLVWPDVSTREALRSFAAGLSVGILTPGRVGELSRGLFLPGRNRSVATGLVVLDRLYTLGTFVSFGLLAASSLYGAGGWGQLGWLRFAVLAWLGVLVWPGTIRRLGVALGRRFAWASELREAARLVHLRHTTLLLLANVGYVLFVAVQFAVAVSAYSPVDRYRGALAGMATLGAKVLIPLSVGDVGVREAASVFFFGLAGVPPAAAFSGALSLYVVNVAVPALLGLRWVADARRSSPEASRAARGSEIPVAASTRLAASPRQKGVAEAS